MTHGFEAPDLVVERLGRRNEAPPLYAISVPAKDEEERVGRCLAGFAAQTGVDLADVSVTLLLNNCTDATLGRVRAFAETAAFAIDAVCADLPPPLANAGCARRLAMEHAASLVRADGYLLASDADTVVDRDWLLRSRLCFEAGIDAIAGFVTADPDELARLDDRVLALGAAEWDYQNLVAELEARCDPLGHDPFPRHNQNCGASMAIRATLYRAVGGLPARSVGEDRALFDAVRRRDGRIRHALDVHVTTSARTIGRAAGGMADALRTRGTRSYFCDDILEAVVPTLRRNLWRRAARAAWRAGALDRWAPLRALDPAMRAQILEATRFGSAWSRFEATHPRLRRKLLLSSDLPRELSRVRKALASLPAFPPA